MIRVLVAALLVCALAAPAAAQPKKVAAAAVALDRRLASEAQAAELALMRAIQNDVRLEAVDLGALARGQPTQALGDGRRKVAEALNLIDEMKGKQALARAAEAFTLLEGADLATSFPELLGAQAARVFALHSEGNKAALKTELGRLFALAPDYKLDARRVTPDLATLAEDARAKAGKSPRVSLSLRSAPVPAAVYVDGAFRGVTPLEVPGLAPGHHYVTLRAAGYELAQGRHAAGLGAPVELTLTPAGQERGLLEILRGLATTAPPGGEGHAAALAKWASVDEVLVAGLQKRGDATVAVVVRWGADGRSKGMVERTITKPEAVEDLARETFTLELAPPPPPVDPVVAARPPGPTGSGTEAGVAQTTGKTGTGRIIGFVCAGLAVASIGGGIGLGVIASQKAEEARNTPAVDTAAYDSARSSAHGMALGANVLYGVAAVAAATGIVLIVTGGADSPAAAPAKKDEFGLSLSPLPGGAMVSLGGAF